MVFSLLFSSTTHYPNPKMLQHRYFYQIIDDGKMFSTRKDRYWATESEKKYYYYYQCRSTTTQRTHHFWQYSLSLHLHLERLSSSLWLSFMQETHGLYMAYTYTVCFSIIERKTYKGRTHVTTCAPVLAVHYMFAKVAKWQMRQHTLRWLQIKIECLHISRHKSIRKYTINGEKIFWMW